jgi:hypothetical protein
MIVREVNGKIAVCKKAKAKNTAKEKQCFVNEG